MNCVNFKNSDTHMIQKLQQIVKGQIYSP